MKRLLITFLLFLVCGSARAGLIFDNGSGQKNDTLVIQFCFLDSVGLEYAAWDTAHIKQCYGSVAFRESVLTVPANYDVNSGWPGTMMYEWRARAADSAGHVGAYTWWAMVTKNYSGKRVRQMHKGGYYVNDDPVEDFLTVADTAENQAVGRLVRDAAPPTLKARVDSIRWAMGMPVSIDGEKYADNLHKKTGAYTGGTGAGGNILDDISALSLTGGGSEACTLVIRQGGIVPIQGARIVIRTLDQSATRVPGLFTNVNGRGIAELDPASYYVSVTANNYVPLADTIVVFQDSSWNMSMTLFDPGSPPSPDLCRVYGWLYDIGGDSLSGVTVSAEILPKHQPVKYGDVIITPFKKAVVSDSLGYWQIDLFPNEILSKPDSKYLFTIEYPSGVILRSEAAVPDSVSWQFR